MLGNLPVFKDELRSYRPAENAVKLAGGSEHHGMEYELIEIVNMG
jgi:hypothetical protein